jgi:hypothetical protein
MRSGEKLKQAVPFFVAAGVLAVWGATSNSSETPVLTVDSLNANTTDVTLTPSEAADWNLFLSQSENVAPKKDCYTNVRGRLGRIFDKMVQKSTTAIKNGHVPDVRITPPAPGGLRQRFDFTYKLIPEMDSYAVFPEGQFGSIDYEHPLEVGSVVGQKGSDRENTVKLRMSQAGQVDFAAHIEYGNYNQDLESDLASISTASTDCDDAEKLPAGPVGTINQDLYELTNGSTFTVMPAHLPEPSH